MFPDDHRDVGTTRPKVPGHPRSESDTEVGGEMEKGRVEDRRVVYLEKESTESEPYTTDLVRRVGGWE